MGRTGHHIQQIRWIYRAGGPKYLALFGSHWLLHRLLGISASSQLHKSRLIRRSVARLRSLLDVVDSGLIDLETAEHIDQPWTITSRRHRFSIADNREWWNRHDWSRSGEEWTPSSEWKEALVDRFLKRYVLERGTAVEIGPGAGRWTEFLAERCCRLHVVDVSDRAIELCRARFSSRTNIHFLLTGQPHISVADASVDAIWSYDVFVHINPADTREYFREFRRVLKADGHVVIHHPGASQPEERVRPATRSDLTNELVLAFAQENDLELIEQTSELVNPGDVLSVFKKRQMQ